jgi:orotidine-5'-phosphate decarboxylase
MNLIDLPRGIIPACDFKEIDVLESLVSATYDIEGVVGYKIGCILGLRHSLTSIVKLVEKYTDLPIIYDHQKAGTDIPQMGSIFADTCAEAGIRGVIIFPQSGPMTEESFINCLKEDGLVPIVGGDMTHPRYLERDGGFLRNDAPNEMYNVAAINGVDNFVIPGNNINSIQKYHILISKLVESPKYYMPGIGRQGGEIDLALSKLENCAAYAIIGTGIYAQEDMRNSAKNFALEMLKK